MNDNQPRGFQPIRDYERRERWEEIITLAERIKARRVMRRAISETRKRWEA